MKERNATAPKKDTDVLIPIFLKLACQSQDRLYDFVCHSQTECCDICGAFVATSQSSIILDIYHSGSYRMN
jgi:hypothetical protein